MKNKTVVFKKIGEIERGFYAEILFNYGSPIKYPYCKGYYLNLTPCTVILDENGKEKIEKDTKFKGSELLFEIAEPSNERFTVAESVADMYLDSLVMKIIQNEIDEKRKIDNVTKKIEGAKLDLEIGMDYAKEEMNEMRGMRNNNNDGNNKSSDGGSYTKSKYYTKPLPVTFDEIAGLDTVKQEIFESIDLIKNREKYETIGVTSSLNNILLSGESGNGKTMLVKAIATELGYPVFQMSGDASEKYVGMTKKNIEQLFNDARKCEQAIVFIDEAEVIAKKRCGEENNSERESGTAELLAQLDGFKTSKDLIVILATNLPDALDDAVLTRMTKKIHISNPDFATRLGILKINAKKMKTEENLNLEKIARNLSGFSGRTIGAILNRAGMLAVRKGKEKIGNEELEEAFEREVAGLKSSTKKLNEHEKQVVSYHEIGHAVTSYLLKSEKIQKISIVPRTGSTLGYVLYANEDEDDKFLKTKEEFLNDIVVSLAGRASEELIFGKVTGGCSNDLEKATRIAENMITRMGMYDDFGLKSIDRKDMFMREKILNKVDEVLNECYEKAKEVLVINRVLIDELAKVLMDKEEMNLEDFEEVVSEIGAII